MSDESKRDEFKKRMYRLMLDVVAFCDSLPKDSVTQKISDQFIRSGTSMGANYFEAKGASSKRDYLKYFEISLKSANESMFWICLLRDSHKCDKQKADKLLKEFQEISKILGSSIMTMKGKTKI